MKSDNSIVFLVPGFPYDEEDTTCIPALQLYIKNLHSANPGTKIIVISFQYPYNRKKYYWNNIRIYCAEGKGKGRIFRLITWLKVILYFIKVNYIYNITGIHSFWLTECAFVGQLIAGIFRIPHIVSIMGQDARSSNKYLRYLKFSKITVTSVSKFAADTFKKSINSKAENIIPFGIENNCSIAPGNNRTIDIIGVGSLIPLKNHSLFVEVIDEVVKYFPSLKVLLIGKGVLKSSIEKYIIEKGLSKNISLIGEVPRCEVLKYMMKSKILLHTSLFESQGLVFLEALYCGLYVVTFNTGYLPASKKIFLCRDKIEMVNDIKELLLNKKDFNREIHITIEDTVKKFKSIYLKLGII